MSIIKSILRHNKRKKHIDISVKSIFHLKSKIRFYHGMAGGHNKALSAIAARHLRHSAI